MQIAHRGDPEHRLGRGDASQQGGDEAGGQRGGFRIQPRRADLVQLAQRQAATQAGIHARIVERQETAGRLAWPPAARQPDAPARLAAG